VALENVSSEDLIKMVADRVDRTPHVKAWWMKLTDEQKAKIGPIRDAYHAGVFGKREITACRALSGVLAELGINIGPQGVKAWLKATI
jgi:hypothetical protein